MLSIEHRELFKDLICTALEGGSNYWYTIDYHNRIDGEYYHEIPFRPDGSLGITDLHGELEAPINLTEEKIIKAWELLRKEYPRHYQDAVQENHDADTGDILLQLALFGKLVFG